MSSFTDCGGQDSSRAVVTTRINHGNKEVFWAINFGSNENMKQSAGKLSRTQK